MNLRYWSNENNLIDLDEVIAIEVRKHQATTYTSVVFKNKYELTLEASGILEQFKEYTKSIVLVPIGTELKEAREVIGYYSRPNGWLNRGILIEQGRLAREFLEKWK
jgi:hypothetical protein